MKNILKGCLLMVILFIAYPSLAQKNFKNVLQIPAEMVPPEEQDMQMQVYNRSITKYRREDVPWIVYSDRANNKTENGKTLDFMDSFYAVDETDTKIYIVKAVVDGLKIKTITEDVGWIDKKNMLLWSDGLVDITTKINLKGFLLNKKESIADIITKKRESDRVRIFNSPDTDVAEEVSKNRIYDFFFIFKKEQIGEIGEMYLLSKNVKISPETKEDVIGWVKSDRITNWNTRIALEPNFNEKAFTERKQSASNKVVKLFDQPEYAIEYAMGNNNHSALWDNDPVKISEDKLAEIDPFRFKGGVIRFPKLEKKEEDNYYKTAVVGPITAADYGRIVGEISEENYASLSVNVNNAIESENTVNILFVIDGTKGMQPYIKSISNSIYRLKDISDEDGKTIRFGAAIYGDVTSQKFEYVEMNEDEGEVISFLREIETSPVSNETNPYNAMYLGINQALIKTNLRKNQTNLIIVVGDTGDDFYKNGKTANISPDAIQNQLKEWNAHVIAYQCDVTGGETAKAFENQMKNMILETAKLSYNDYTKLSRIKNYNKLILGSPILDNQTNELKSGAIYGAYRKVKSPIDLEDEISYHIKKATKYAGQVSGLLSDFFENGESFDSKGGGGPLGPAIVNLLSKMKDKLSEEDLENLSYEKYQFYLEAYTPIKIDAAIDECFSDVLFMPRKDLSDLVDRLDYLVRSASYNPKQKRKGVIDTWYELLRIYTGEKNFEQLANLTIDKLNSMMQGVEKEGIKFKSRKPLGSRSIKDITNKRVVTDEEINEYIREMTKNHKELNDILREGRNYEFSYTSNGNTYYWIPSDFLP